MTSLVETPKNAQQSLNKIPLLSIQVDVYIWNAEEARYALEGSGILQITGTSPFSFQISCGTQSAFSYQLDSEGVKGQLFYLRGNTSFTWNSTLPYGGIQTYAVHIFEASDFQKFASFYAAALWDKLRPDNRDWQDLEESEKEYTLSSFTSLMNGISVATEDDGIEELDESDNSSSSVSDENDHSEGEEYDRGGNERHEDSHSYNVNEESNTVLATGFKERYAYVARGSNIDVFHPTSEDNVLQAKFTIPNISYAGAGFQPHQILHQNDRKLILLDAESLFCVDLERHNIVEKWKIQDEVSLRTIAPTTKFAPMTPEQTIIGCSRNSLFLIDPRLPRTKLVNQKYMQYSGQPMFSVISTTEAGYLVAGSELGQIRLYDSVGKRAKTSLPVVGDAVIGVDTTSDGRWVLATTKEYILLIDTMINDGPKSGLLGFEYSIPMSSRHLPYRLSLRTEHAREMGSSISFTPARFNVDRENMENAIITSTGHFLISWNFDEVKRGVLDSYVIRRYHDDVVQGTFRLGDQDQIIVALKNAILAQNRKSLQKPSRRSLGNVYKAKGATSSKHSKSEGWNIN